MNDDVKELIFGIAIGAAVQIFSWFFFHRRKQLKSHLERWLFNCFLTSFYVYGGIYLFLKRYNKELECGLTVKS